MFYIVYILYSVCKNNFEQVWAIWTAFEVTKFNFYVDKYSS